MKMRLATWLAAAALAVPQAALPQPTQDQVAAWRQYAASCSDGVPGYPSKQDCDDGDATLFNGLLCAAGLEQGCDGVRRAQSPDGRWHRSPRYAADPLKRANNSLSPDMAIGVQLYLLKTRDSERARKWAQWLERAVACTFEGPEGCVYRNPFPRFCTDDTEKGCTIRPGDAATLALTLSALGELPSASTTLGSYLLAFRDLHPRHMLLDAVVNRAGYPRHLAAASIMVATLAQPTRPPELMMAAQVLSAREPLNPMFASLAGKPRRVVGELIVRLCPSRDAAATIEKKEWAWERTDSDQAWLMSSLWDCIFAHALLPALP